MELQQETDSAFSGMIRVLSSFSEDEVNTVPFEGSWTPGQVVEHILKSTNNLQQLFYENTEPTTNRPVDERVNEIQTIFLDYTLKMQSPEFIVPSSTDHQKEMLIKQLQLHKSQAIDAAKNLDLSYTCKVSEFPNWGFLTRLEWLTFIACHVQRHTRQLANIKSHLQAQKAVQRNR